MIATACDGLRIGCDYLPETATRGRFDGSACRDTTAAAA